MHFNSENKKCYWINVLCLEDFFLLFDLASMNGDWTWMIHISKISWLCIVKSYFPQNKANKADSMPFIIKLYISLVYYCSYKGNFNPMFQENNACGSWNPFFWVDLFKEKGGVLALRHYWIFYWYCTMSAAILLWEERKQSLSLLNLVITNDDNLYLNYSTLLL